jgi:hypothetical protein
MAHSEAQRPTQPSMSFVHATRSTESARPRHHLDHLISFKTCLQESDSCITLQASSPSTQARCPRSWDLELSAANVVSSFAQPPPAFIRKFQPTAPKNFARNAVLLGRDVLRGHYCLMDRLGSLDCLRGNSNLLDWFRDMRYLRHIHLRPQDKIGKLVSYKFIKTMPLALSATLKYLRQKFQGTSFVCLCRSCRSNLLLSSSLDLRLLFSVDIRQL